MGKFFNKNAALSKEAKRMDIADIEDHVGFYFRDKDEPTVRRLIDREYDKSFSLRHPVLTGIPTLGIAPAIARDSATDNITRNLVRKDEWVRRQKDKVVAKYRREALEDAKTEAQLAEANRYSNAIGAAGAIANRYFDYKSGQ